MLEVQKIKNSFFDSNTWLLSATESNQVWLVDCGDIAPIKDKISGKIVVGVLLTHAHYDHIYGLPKLLDIFPECRIYTNSYGKEALASNKKNLSRYHEDSIEINESFVTLIKEGNEIELFPDIKAFVYETPGHNPSCLCIRVGDYFFTGDACIPGLQVVTNLPDGDKQKAKESLERIQTLIQNKTICAGHS